MSKIATIDIVVNIQGDGTNDTFRLSNGAWVTTFSNSVGMREQRLLGTGGNSITLPLTSDNQKPSMLIILPPATSANAKNLTGASLTFVNQPVVYQIPPATVSMNVTNTGSNEYDEFIWI